MMTEGTSEPRPAEAADARALQLRLYREIGISAVAGALACAKLADLPGRNPHTRHTPAMVGREAKAA